MTHKCINYEIYFNLYPIEAIFFLGLAIITTLTMKLIDKDQSEVIFVMNVDKHPDLKHVYMINQKCSKTVAVLCIWKRKVRVHYVKLSAFPLIDSHCSNCVFHSVLYLSILWYCAFWWIQPRKMQHLPWNDSLFWSFN